MLRVAVKTRPPDDKPPALLAHAICSACRSGRQVILSCTSNWTPAGGVDYYANATGISRPCREKRLFYCAVQLDTSGLVLPHVPKSRACRPRPLPHHLPHAPPLPAPGLDHNAFFSSPAPKALFKKYIAAIVGRKNTITGRAYSQDPTIMWEAPAGALLGCLMQGELTP